MAARGVLVKADIRGFLVNQVTADTRARADIQDTARSVDSQDIVEVHLDFPVIVLRQDSRGTAARVGIQDSAVVQDTADIQGSVRQVREPLVLADFRDVQDTAEHWVVQDIQDFRQQVPELLDIPGTLENLDTQDIAALLLLQSMIRLEITVFY